MGYTHLTPTGTPGRSYSFSAKTEATVPKGTGPFTQLTVLGTSGQIHSFLPKTVAGVSKGVGPFTRLSVLGVPGRLHPFSIKTEAEVIETIEGGSGSTGQIDLVRLKQKRLIQDDFDILEFVMLYVMKQR